MAKEGAAVVEAQESLLYSARHGELAVVKALLEAKAEGKLTLNVSCKGKSKSNLGWTPLHLATYFGHTDVVAALLEAGANVDEVNDTGDTALHKASFIGNEDLVILLLKYKADVNIMNGEGRTPCDVSKTRDVQRLLEAAKRAERHQRESKLLTAAKEGRVEDIHELNIEVMQQPVKKRQRGENWLQEDKLILKELVRQRVRAIENKNTDTNSNSMKVAAWNDLRERFNCMCKGAPRTVTQLKAQWGLLKKKKKVKAEESKELLKTGGGPPTIIRSDGISSEDISSRLSNDIDKSEFIIEKNEFDIEKHEFDSDRMNQDVAVPTPNPPSPGNLKKEPSEPSPPPVASDPKPKTKKKVFKVCRTSAEHIASVEIQCRRELHAIQMENEQQKKINLKLKEILIKEKIKFYKDTNYNNNETKL